MANTTAEQVADLAIVKRGDLLVQQPAGCCVQAVCCLCLLCGCGGERWTQCFIVLQQGALSIYEREHDVMPADIVNLYGSAVVLPVQPKVSRGNVIEVLTPKRSVFLCAGSISDVQDWALAIQKAAIMETSGKLVVPPLLHTQYKHEQQLHAAASATPAAGVAVAGGNPYAALRAAQEAKAAQQKPQAPIAMSARSSLLGNEVRSDYQK